MANKAGHVIFLSTTAVFGFPTRVTLLQTRKKRTPLLKVCA